MAFLRRHGGGPDEAALRGRAEALSARSVYPMTDDRPRVYLGELLDGSDVEYVAFDIFLEAPGCRIFDLNYHSLPEPDKGSFDVVLNFGTTEHVFNQFNCFKVIHEATRPGGHIFHQLPCSGYMDHGYWVYSPRTFLDLAEANDYETVALWCTGPQGRFTLSERVTYHPAARDAGLPENNLAAWEATPLTDGLVNVLYRKRSDRPFALGLDMTTSVGGLGPAVLNNYLDASADSPRLRRPAFRDLVLSNFRGAELLAELVRRLKVRVKRRIGLGK